MATITISRWKGAVIWCQLSLLTKSCSCCSHFKRVVGYARREDYIAGGLAAAFAPAALYTLEKFAPSHVGRGGFAKAMRLAGFVGLAGGFLYFYQRSARTWTTRSTTSETTNANPQHSAILRRHRELERD